MFAMIPVLKFLWAREKNIGRVRTGTVLGCTDCTCTCRVGCGALAGYQYDDDISFLLER